MNARDCEILSLLFSRKKAICGVNHIQGKKQNGERKKWSNHIVAGKAWFPLDLPVLHPRQESVNLPKHTQEHQPCMISDSDAHSCRLRDCILACITMHDIIPMMLSTCRTDLALEVEQLVRPWCRKSFSSGSFTRNCPLEAVTTGLTAFLIKK